MEILFLYIDDYKILKEANINFGGEYLFEYSKKTNKLSYIINKNYIEGFYSLDDSQGITNYSYLVGNNGAGKSTTLEFIKENLVQGSNLRSEAIIIYKINNGFKIETTFNIKTDFNFASPIKKLTKPKSQLDSGFDFGYPLRGIENLDIIFFSNIFDGKIEGGIKGLHNISTNCLIIDDYKFYVEQKLIKPNENPINIHISEEVYRQFNFLTSQFKEDFNLFNISKVLYLKVSFNTEATLLVEFSDEKLSSQYNLWKDILLNHIINLRSELNDSLKSYICFLILNLIKEILSYNNSNIDINIQIKHRFPYSSEDGFSDILNRIFQNINEEAKKNKTFYHLIESDIQRTFDFIEFIIVNNEKLINRIGSINDPSFYISIEEQILIKEIFKLYNNSVKINPHSFFNFSGLSSGERAMLNIFSRFYKIIMDNNKYGNLSNNVLILMDEPDLYLHPSWHKKLNYFLIKYLPKLFFNTKINSNRNIQVIITSNSPIPLSDITSNNVSFFKIRNINSENEIKELEISNFETNNTQTFAENIYSLFKDSFFIDDGMSGNFSTQKITELITFLEKDQEKSSFWEKNALRLINMIGEPIVRNSLRELYFKKFQNQIDDEIKRLMKLKST
ncbi:AAA family ATPase [Flavobacterium piscis]|uniref:ATPase AAA-type core domain-containing protein n=1 Tax=Flavobacterium piscis TaxID=1114874 RepID=A0ABU1Y8N2_9FLAO|nr:AAA family ATPase [Flavobacterium piscis]MDR7210508.1 hypothetical protein [Flavobacterium piscis]